MLPRLGMCWKHDAGSIRVRHALSMGYELKLFKPTGMCQCSNAYRDEIRTLTLPEVSEKRRSTEMHSVKSGTPAHRRIGNPLYFPPPASRIKVDRGRNDALDCAAPPSEPVVRISRKRLSSQQVAS